MKSNEKQMNLIACSFVEFACIPSREQRFFAADAGAAIEIPNYAGKFDCALTEAPSTVAAHEKDGTPDILTCATNTLITRLTLGGAVDTAIDADSKRY